jgi:hypothetical protein
MDKPAKLQYDPEEYPSLSLEIDGPLTVTNTKFKFHEGDSKEVCVRVKAMVSDEDLLDHIKVVSRGDDDGFQRIMVKTPKTMMPHMCIRVDIEVVVPKGFTYFRDLRMAYVAGRMDFDSGFSNVHYGKLFVGVVSSDINFDQKIHAETINLDVVRGDIDGHFHIKKTFQAASVRGDINACVSMKEEDETKIMATTIRGDVYLKVSKLFAGSFYAGNMRGDVGVGGEDVDMDIDKDHLKQGLHVPPDVDKKNANSMIRATSIRGDVEVDFV